MSLRKIIKIAVTGDAKKLIASFAEKHDMTEIGVASRIYQWWAAQDDVVRKGVLGMLPEGYEDDVAELALKRMIGEKGKGRK